MANTCVVGLFEWYLNVYNYSVFYDINSSGAIESLSIIMDV